MYMYMYAIAKIPISILIQSVYSSQIYINLYIVISLFLI